MPRRKKSSDTFYMIAFLMMIVIFIAITAYPAAIGLDPDVGYTLTNLFPSLFLGCIAIYSLKRADKTGKFGGFMVMGIALCLFIAEADAEGLISAQMLTGLTVLQTQVWIMAVSTFMGALLFSR